MISDTNLIGRSVEFVAEETLEPFLKKNRNSEDRWEKCRELDHEGRGTVGAVGLNANNGRFYVLIVARGGKLYHRDFAAVRVLDTQEG